MDNIYNESHNQLGDRLLNAMHVYTHTYISDSQEQNPFSRFCDGYHYNLTFSPKRSKFYVGVGEARHFLEGV